MATRIPVILSALLIGAAPVAAQQSTSTGEPQATPSSSAAPSAAAPDAEQGARDRGSSTPGSTTPPAGGTPFVAEQAAGQIKSDELVGTGVIGTDGEEVGGIQSLILDEGGQVVAAVVGVGGFLGIGKKEVALPWDVLEPARNEKGDQIIRAPVTKAGLEEAPTFRSREEIEAQQRRAAVEQKMKSSAQDRALPSLPASPAGEDADKKR
jgi:sporulation protein YlmC with PRC-barrel domain